MQLPDYRTMLRLLAGYVPAWFAIGAGTWAITRSLDPHAPFGNVFAAAVVSWIVGFLLVPVPGGVGVREGAFTALVSLPHKGVAATAAILARLAFMLVDGGGAVLTPLVVRDRTPGDAPAGGRGRPGAPGRQRPQSHRSRMSRGLAGPPGGYAGSSTRPSTLPSRSANEATFRPAPTSCAGSLTTAPHAVTSASFCSMSPTCQ